MQFHQLPCYVRPYCPPVKLECLGRTEPQRYVGILLVQSKLPPKLLSILDIETVFKVSRCVVDAERLQLFRKLDGRALTAAQIGRQVGLDERHRETFLDILSEESFPFYLQLLKGDGVTHAAEVVVGRDAADVEASFRAGRGEVAAEISGSVAWAGGGVPDGARVGVFEDTDSSGDLGDDDVIRTFMDVDASGNFSGAVMPGDYFLRADVHDVARSAVQEVSVGASGLSGVALELPDPVYFDYSIVNDADENFIPGRIIVFGRHPAEPDMRVYETYDRV